MRFADTSINPKKYYNDSLNHYWFLFYRNMKTVILVLCIFLMMSEMTQSGMASKAVDLRRDESLRFPGALAKILRYVIFFNLSLRKTNQTIHKQVFINKC